MQSPLGVWLMRSAMTLCGALAGCDALIVDVMIKAPNHHRQVHAVDATGTFELKLMRIDQQIAVDVGPPPARLRAWVIEPTDKNPDRIEPRGTILVIHGRAAELRWHLRTARQFAADGYRAVLVDLRGHGGSSGDYLTYGAHETPDLVQVIDDLERRGLLTRPLGVWGLSMGASITIQLAGADKRVDAAVAVAPYTSMRDVVRHVIQSYLPIRKLTDAECDTLIAQAGEIGRFDPNDADTLAALERTEAPTLIVHGKWDAVIPHAQSERLAEVAGRRGKLVSLAYTGHVGAYFDVGDRIRRASTEWFDEKLTR